MAKPEEPTNRGFQQFDPQKHFSGTGRSSGGNFADDPERASGRPADSTSRIRDSGPAPLGEADAARGESMRPLKEPEDQPSADRGRAEQLRRRPQLPT